MFDQVFLLKLILAFVISGSYAVFSVYIAERLGTKWGGIILALPTTVVWSLLFIGLTQDVSQARLAALNAPIGMVISPVFVFLFVHFLDRFKLNAILVALGAWVLGAAILLPFHFSFEWFFLLGLISFLLTCPSLSKVKVPRNVQGSTYTNVVLRFLFVGGFVSIVVVCAKLLGPDIGGLLSTFPALFTSTFILSYKQKGLEFTKSIAAKTIYSFFGLMVYPFAAYSLLASNGLFEGIVGAYCASLLAVFVSNLIFSTFSTS